MGSKSESLFHQRKNPRKIAWTIFFRRMHKKGITEEVAKKRSRKTVKHQRGIVGASLDQINARRNQKPEVRAAAQAQALAKSKDAKKARAEARKEEKAKSAAAPGRANVRIHRDADLFFAQADILLCIMTGPQGQQDEHEGWLQGSPGVNTGVP